MRQTTTRYIAIGVWNTFFGLGNFYALIWIMGRSQYILVLTISYVLSILQAHFSQHFFVWRSNAPYIRELLVFGGGMTLQYVFNAIFLFASVKWLHADPRLAQLFVAAVLAIVGYFFNREIVFKKKTTTPSR